jgi:hypothetical protein
MDGTANVGTGTTWARADHVHPSDTSRYAAANPAGYQTAANVTTALAPYAPLNNPVFTGTVTLPADPSAALQAATKQYVDAHGATPGSAIVFIGDTPPSSPAVGGLWWDSVGGQLYTFYNDGNSSQWVVANNSPAGPAGPAGATGATGPAGAQGPAGPQGVFGPGVTDGSNAAAGQVGEVISSTVTAGVALTSNTTIVVASIALTPGDWEVFGNIFVSIGTGAPSSLSAALSLTANLPASVNVAYSRTGSYQTFTASTPAQFVVGAARNNSASSFTYYLLVNATFPSGSPTATGVIWARRAR